MHRPHFLYQSVAVAGSFGLHLLLVLAIIHYTSHAPRPPEITPVEIVDLPKEVIRKLPAVKRPVPPPQERDRYNPPAAAIPAPRHFGDAPDVAVPRTAPARPGQGTPDGTGTDGEDRSRLGSKDQNSGPLPFLSQADIDELARKGMPAKRPGDDSVTLDTGEFKYISYNRWLKVRVESMLKYPELAALSGLQGTLYIQFDILKDGTLGGLELLKSSGYKILDDEALRAIRASAPFQPLPEEWQEEHYSIRAAVLFYLSEAYIR